MGVVGFGCSVVSCGWCQWLSGVSARINCIVGGAFIAVCGTVACCWLVGGVFTSGSVLVGYGADLLFVGIPHYLSVRVPVGASCGTWWLLCIHFFQCIAITVDRIVYCCGLSLDAV